MEFINQKTGEKRELSNKKFGIIWFNPDKKMKFSIVKTCKSYRLGKKDRNGIYEDDRIVSFYKFASAIRESEKNADKLFPDDK